MKKIIMMCMVLLGGVYTTTATASTAEDYRFRSFNDRFIFVENGIEFAVFPDGQFDFNYLDYGPNFNLNISTQGSYFSFNTGFQYDRFVQYDIYGAVIQIENTPIFYDAWGRVAQIGNININYRNGFVNRLGGLRVFYNNVGVVSHFNGFINPFNRFYVYRPWHRFYTVPVVNRCIVYNNPYRRFYNPIRYNWNYHRLHWNSPVYYNGFYARGNRGRAFYRPSDRVIYREFERGRRNSRGIAVTNNRGIARNRAEIARGGRSLDRGISTNRIDRSNRNNSRSIAGVDNTFSNGRDYTRQVDRSRSTRTNREVSRTNRNNSRSEARTNRSSRTEMRTSSSRSSRSNVSTSRSSNRNSSARSTRGNSSNNRSSGRTARTRS